MLDQSLLPAPGSRIGVACSGGADSTALLLLLADLGQYELTVVHVNHGLRGQESDDDERFCRELARTHGAQFLVRRALARGRDSSRPINLEEAAREARYEFFLDFLQNEANSWLATGHTRDDQAETVLFRLLRGAHTDGLAGVHPKQGRIIRPLLNASKTDLRDFLTKRSQSWREDSSNASRDFDRNRIRLDLIPLLERDWNPEVSKTLAQTANLAFEDRQFWTSYIEDRAASLFTIHGNTAVVAASTLLSEQLAVARRLVRWAIRRVKGSARQIGYQHVQAVLDLCKLAEGNGRVILPGVDVMRSFDWVRFAKYDPLENEDRLALRNREVQLEVPGEATAADGSRIVLEFTCGGSDTVKAACDAVCWNPVVESGDWVLRSWRPGDCYRPAGWAAPRKLKELFQEHRVPLWDRGAWPIITLDSKIVWARDFGPAHERVGEGPRVRVVRIP